MSFDTLLMLGFSVEAPGMWLIYSPKIMGIVEHTLLHAFAPDLETPDVQNFDLSPEVIVVRLVLLGGD